MARVLMEYTATPAGVLRDSLGRTVKHVGYQVEYILKKITVPKKETEVLCKPGRLPRVHKIRYFLIEGHITFGIYRYYTCNTKCQK